MNDVHRESVDLVRRALLEFHRTLIEAARIDYERVHGRLQSSSDYLRLLTGDPSFAWLRPMSELILALDELGDMVSATDADAAAVRVEVERLLGEGEGGMERHYSPLLEVSPDPIIALSQLQKIVRRLPATEQSGRAEALTRRGLWQGEKKRR